MLVTQLIFDIHVTDIPQKRENFMQVLVSFMTKPQNINSFGPIAPNVRLIFTETPFIRLHGDIQTKVTKLWPHFSNAKVNFKDVKALFSDFKYLGR